MASSTNGKFDVKIKAIFPGSIRVILEFAHKKEQGLRKLLEDYASNISDVTETQTLQPQVWVNSLVIYNIIMHKWHDAKQSNFEFIF